MEDLKNIASKELNIEMSNVEGKATKTLVQLLNMVGLCKFKEPRYIDERSAFVYNIYQLPLSQSTEGIIGATCITNGNIDIDVNGLRFDEKISLIQAIENQINKQ